MTPQLADYQMVQYLAINITGSGGVIPEANMNVALGQANRYVDAKMAQSYPNWWMVNFVPEMRPEQVVVAASLIAAGKIEQMMYAVNTAYGKVNPYGAGMEAEGYAIIEDIINYRLPVIGWLSLAPVIGQAPKRRLRWVGGLVTQGWLPLLNADLEACNPLLDFDATPSLQEQLQGLGIDSYSPIPSAYWYDAQCLAMSTSYINSMTMWNQYISTLMTDIGSLNIQSIYGATPGAASSVLYAFIVGLATQNMSYVAQSAIGQDNTVYDAIAQAGVELMIAGPYSSSPSQDVSPAIMEENLYAYSQHIVSSTPQFVSTNPPIAPYQGIASGVGYTSQLNELSPRSTSDQIAFYSGRQIPSWSLAMPLVATLGIDSSSASSESEGPYLLWAMCKIWIDQNMTSNRQQGEFSVSFPQFVLFEHVDENGSAFGLRSFDGVNWNDKPAMTMFRNLAALMPTFNGNAQPQLRVGIRGLSNFNAVAFAIGNGQVALLLNTGLIEGQTASVSFQFLQQWKINGYQPTVSTDLAFSGLGSCFSVDLDYQPLLLVMTSVPSY